VAVFGVAASKVLIFATVLFLVALVFISAFNFFMPRVFRLENARNLLLITSSTATTPRILLVTFDPDTKSTEVAAIDPELPVKNVLGGYREYPLRSIAPLFALEQKDNQALLAAYHFALGEVIDEIYFVDELPAVENRGQLSGVFRHLINNYWQAEHQWPEKLLEAYFFVRETQNVDFEVVTVTSENLTTFHNRTAKLGGSTAVCPLVLVNATAQNGLAAKVAGVLEKDGLRVTRRMSGDAPQANNTIYYDPDNLECQAVLARLKQFFPSEPELVENKEILQNYRANLVVVLGDELKD
jgi:hypothetical protein